MLKTMLLPVLNPKFISCAKPFFRLLPSIQSLGKQSACCKHQFFTRGLSNITQENESTSDSDGRFVQMRGLPFEATTADIINFFRPLNIEPVEVNIETNRIGRPNGFASVKFKSYDHALKALRNHRNYMGRRYIELSLDVRPVNLSHSHFPQNSLESTSNAPVKGHGIVLKGLPYEATASDVIQFFAPLNIKPFRIKMRQGRFNLPSGICDCTFESREEALTALKNHKAYIGRRWIEVFLESHPEASMNHEDSDSSSVRYSTH